MIHNEKAGKNSQIKDKCLVFAYTVTYIHFDEKVHEWAYEHSGKTMMKVSLHDWAYTCVSELGGVGRSTGHILKSCTNRSCPAKQIRWLAHVGVVISAVLDDEQGDVNIYLIEPIM